MCTPRVAYRLRCRIVNGWGREFKSEYPGNLLALVPREFESIDKYLYYLPMLLNVRSQLASLGADSKALKRYVHDRKLEVDRLYNVSRQVFVNYLNLNHLRRVAQSSCHGHIHP